MLTDLTQFDRLYAALLARDADYEGRAFVGVTSTGIFCRLTCPARKPKPGNCRFFATVGACLEAGFRPCRRCRPLTPAGQSDLAIARLLGQSPADFTADARLLADWIDTRLGPMLAVSDPEALHLLEFVDRRTLPTELRALRDRAGGTLGLGRHPPTTQVAGELDAYFAGKAARFATPLCLHGSPFTRTVWAALRRIPPGETRTYGQIAAAIGRPSAARAVARANGANRIAVVIPCHRVIGADGSLTGYGGGLWRKRRLIDMERDVAAAMAGR